MKLFSIDTFKNIKNFFVIDNLDEQIVKLNNAKQAATNYWDAINVNGKSKELAAQAGMMKNLDKETKELIVTSRNRAHAEEVLTNKIRVQTGAQKLLNKTISAGAKIVKTAGSIALSIAISYAISGIISWIDKLVNAEKKEKELAKERAEEAKQQLEAQKQYAKDISNIVKEYEELGKVTNKTEEQKQALIDLQNQLVETFGKEAKGIDLVNGKYEKQIELLQKMSSDQYKQQYLKSLETYQNAENEFNNNKTNTVDIFGDSKDFQGIRKQAEVNVDDEIYTVMRVLKGEIDGSRIQTYNPDLYKYIKELADSGKYIEDPKVREEIIQWWQKYIYTQGYTNNQQKEKIEIYDILSKIDGVSFYQGQIEISSDLNASEKVSAIDNIVDVLIEETSKEFKNTEQYTSIMSRLIGLRDDYQKQVSEFNKQEKSMAEGWAYSFEDSNGNTFEDLLKREINSFEDWMSVLKDYRKFKSEIDDDFSGDTGVLYKFLRENLFSVLSSRYKSAVNPTTPYYKSIDEIFEEYSDDIDNLKSKVSEFDGYLEKIRSGSLSSEEKLELFKLHPELVGVEDLEAELVKLRDDAINSLADEIAGLRVPEELQDELQAIVDSIKGLSKLSINEYASLISSQYDQEINRVNEEISAIEKLKDKEIERYEEKIEKLKEQNEEQEKANELEKAAQELERARTQKTLKVWRSGVGWTWETDKSAIAEAEKNFESLQREEQINSLEKQKEEITSRYDAEIEGRNNYIEQIEEHKKELEDYTTDIENYFKRQQLASDNLTLELEGDYNQRLLDLQEYQTKTENFLDGLLDLEYGKIIAQSIIGNRANKVDLTSSNAIWSWSNQPASGNKQPISTSGSTSNQVNYNYFTIGTVVANDPIEFTNQMNKYISENNTKSIIK